MTINWAEFLMIASIHLLAVASPGPDFAVVVRQVISHGRSSAIVTSVGVGSAILLHVTYCLLGIGVLFSQSPTLFDLFKYLAAGYLVWLAYQGLKSQPNNGNEISAETGQMSSLKAFTTGFVTNGLNPKATLFFLSLFAVIINPQTELSVKIFYGLYMAVATALWFSFVSYVLSTKRIRQVIMAKGFWFDRIMGVVLLLLAIHLVTSELTS